MTPFLSHASCLIKTFTDFTAQMFVHQASLNNRDNSFPSSEGITKTMSPLGQSKTMFAISYCFSYSSHCYGQISETSNLRGKILILIHGLKIMMGRHSDRAHRVHSQETEMYEYKTLGAELTFPSLSLSETAGSLQCSTG